jgi:uncharacterized protein
VKLVVREAESDSLRELVERNPHQVASAIVEVEVERAVRRVAPGIVADARRAVAALNLIEPGESIRARAARLDPPELRTLDALHLATALEVGDELNGFVAYDSRLAAAAAAAGLTVLAPA